MKKNIFISFLIGLALVGCKKKKEDQPTPDTTLPIQAKERVEYGYFKGSLDGNLVSYMVYLDYQTPFTSYLSNGASISSSSTVPSKYSYGNTIQKSNGLFGITLSLGMLNPPLGQAFPTKQEFYNFFTIGKFALVEDQQNGARVSIFEKTGSEYKFFNNTIQSISDTSFVEITKIITGTEYGVATVYYEAKLSATLVESTTGEKRVIRNALMKGAFQPDNIKE